MVGNPKYKIGDCVKFAVNNEIVEGKVCIIDKYGTFFDDSDVSYDVLGNDNIFYKHINEKLIK